MRENLFPEDAKHCLNGYRALRNGARRGEVISSDMSAQIVDTKNAKYPLTLDPDAGWWAATAAKCAVDIAPLVATGGAAVASRVPKLVSFLNKLRKTKKIAAAIDKIGGMEKAVKAIAKKAVQVLRSKVVQSVRKHLPSVTLNSKDKALISAAWPIVADWIWDLLGFGGCKQLVTGK